MRTMIDVRVKGVSKRFRVPDHGEGRRRLLGLLPGRELFWALRDVSFEIRRGEALGVIGPNGSGKTTLIKLLSGITAPTEGEIEITGRLASLVEVGAGFQPDLTGRENIFLNGAILGMSYREIARKLPSIVDFAEMGTFLDVPVKRYSSGMFVRLGFSIAAHLDADILLLDEVLAVGDVSFQARCFERIEELRQAGKTVLLISHDLAAIERICSRAILLSGGRVLQQGDPRDVIEAYQASVQSLLAQDPGEASGPVTITGLTFDTAGAGPVATGKPFRCRLSYEAKQPVDDAVVRLSFNWPSGYLCTELATEAGFRLEQGPGQVEFDCPLLTMQRGLYSADLCIERRGEILLWRPRCVMLRVGAGRIVRGDFYLEHSARIRTSPLATSG
jgi:ABC-type polysaccharide/polyol phosphate transport system ATPase subunit